MWRISEFCFFVGRFLFIFVVFRLLLSVGLFYDGGWCCQFIDWCDVVLSGVDVVLMKCYR